MRPKLRTYLASKGSTGWTTIVLLLCRGERLGLPVTHLDILWLRDTNPEVELEQRSQTRRTAISVQPLCNECLDDTESRVARCLDKAYNICEARER